MQEVSSGDCRKRSIPIYIRWMKQDKMTDVLFFTKLKMKPVQRKT
jgi:hypothetical protein